MANPPDGQSCETCRYCVKDRDGAEDFRCRRLPKSRGESRSHHVDWRFPLMLLSDWCGEYAPANPETIEDGAIMLARLVLLGDRAAAYALADKLKAREA